MFNYGNGSAALGTSQLADPANVRMRHITNGHIFHGPSGGTIVNGTVRATASATRGGIGNTWVAIEISANGTAGFVNRFGGSTGSDGGRLCLIRLRHLS